MSESTAATKLPNWDMTPYFTELGAEDYRLFRERLARDADELRDRVAATAPVGPESADAWASLLVALEDLYGRFRHLGSYLGCMAAAQSDDDDIARESSGLSTLGARLSKVYIAMRAALADAGDDAFAALVARADLAPVRHKLTRLRTLARTSMAPELEGLAADLAVDGISAWGRLYGRVSAKLAFTLERPDGTSETLPVSVARSLMEDPDAAVRVATKAGADAAWASVADSVAACLNAIAGTRLTLYARRGIEHFLEPALFDAGIERATLDAMLDAVRARQELPRRYLRHKAALLGCDRLGYQDLSAPIPGAVAARIGWDDARARVLAAFGAAYPALAELAGRAFADRWIDYEPRAAKRPGGFCSTSPVIGQSRVFMTFNGAIGDVQTLAHELGHAFHGWQMRDMRPWSREYPMTLAETASTFAETLVTDAVLDDPEATPAMRTAILNRRLQDATAFMLDIPSRYDFEHALYTERAGGELSVTRLKQLMEAAQRGNFGDAIAEGALDPWLWASKLHYYITGVNFYNFPYTFGYLFSMGLAARFKAEGAPFLATYEQLLRATGSDTPENIARDLLGVDLRSPEFWAKSIDLIGADLERFEALPAGLTH